VVELGAGLGLCGILSSQLNPHGRVVITDGDELAVEKLQANVDLNPPSEGCVVDTRLLLWGQHESFVVENPGGFDVILAADVLYEEEAGEYRAKG